MTEDKQLQFCVEVFRQRILSNPNSPGYVKDVFETMLKMMPDLPEVPESTCMAWVTNAAHATGCSTSETQALQQMTRHIYAKPH